LSGATQLPAYPPLSFSQILDRIFRLLRINFRTLLGIGVVPAAVLFICYGGLAATVALTSLPAIPTRKQPPPVPSSLGVLTAFTIVMLVQLIVFALFLAAASYAAAQLDRGVPVTAAEAYGIALGRAGHFILLILSMYGICFFPAWLLEAGLFGCGAAATASKNFPPLLIVLIPIGVLLLLAAIIAGVVLALRLSLAFPASVFEALTVRQAIRRSWALTQGVTGKIFLVVLVVYAALYVAMLAVMMIAMFVGAIGYLIFSGYLTHPSTQTIWKLVICAVAFYLGLISALSGCCWAGFASSLSVIYNDQRRVIDGSPVSLDAVGVQG
jgi:hypothetical protein